MPVLKKGSKGNPVKELQTLLNKAGAKPPLKVDGIFGKNTDVAVRAFQKRAKLKTDGKAGNLTLAAVRFGGPLPEMSVEDYKKWLATWRGKWIINSRTIDGFEDIHHEIKKVASVLDKQMPIAVKFISENRKHKDTINKLGAEIVDRQKKFENALAKSPQTAQKLAKECVDLDKRVQSLYEGTMKPNIRKAAKGTQASADQIVASLAKIEISIRNLKALAKTK